MPRRIVLDDPEDELESETSDMQVSDSDVEVEVEEPEDANEPDGQQDIELDEGIPDAEVEVEEDDMLSDKDELADDDVSDLEALSSSPGPGEEENTEAAPTPQPKLKIKLRLPAQNSSIALSTATTATSTPDARSRAASRRGGSRDIEIESEDEDEDEEMSTRSASVATTVTPGRPLTARQAVLRNVVETTHVSLVEPPNPRKKKPLTEIEMALKREETARKRKNLSEKKLEDEKAETINRLLKKQSRSKGKRNALSTAEDRPTPGQATPANNHNSAEAEDEGEGSAGPAPIIPTMYRWVSSIKSISGSNAEEGDESEHKTMVLSFSVPIRALPRSKDETSGETPMDVDEGAGSDNLGPPPEVPTRCDVEGCDEKRKYRLVKDWERGACGMAHLKVLESRLGTVN